MGCTVQQLTVEQLHIQQQLQLKFTLTKFYYTVPVICYRQTDSYISGLIEMVACYIAITK